jgi:glycerophosphoryl diester phosphodiesterase
LIVAHRGASADAPENTLAAFKLAFDRGADAIEGDFHLTRDGKIIGIHDADTKRTTGVAGKIVETDFDRLRRLDAGKWKGAEFKGEKLPTLPEVLALVGPGKRFFIEIKCGPEIIPELKRILGESKVPADQLTIISFKDAVISEARKELPQIKAYWLFDFKETKGQWNLTPEQAVARARALGAHGIDIGVTAKTLPLVRELAPKAKEAGLELHVWTIDDVVLAREAAALGAMSITTNRPGWLRGQLGSR